MTIPLLLLSLLLRRAPLRGAAVAVVVFAALTAPLTLGNLHSSVGLRHTAGFLGGDTGRRSVLDRVLREADGRAADVDVQAVAPPPAAPCGRQVSRRSRKKCGAVRLTGALMQEVSAASSAMTSQPVYVVSSSCSVAPRGRGAGGRRPG